MKVLHMQRENMTKKKITNLRCFLETMFV